MSDQASAAASFAMAELVFDPVACLPLAAEFMARPVGRHSPNLQRLLRVMRAQPPTEKPCLLTLEPGRKWALIQLAGPRGHGAVALGPVYTDLLEAERDVFRRRWKQIMGVDLPADPAAP